MSDEDLTRETGPAEIQALRDRVAELEKAQIESELRESLVRFTALMDSLRLGVLFEDAMRHVLYVNQAFCRLFNLPGPQAIIGADCAAAAQHVKTMFRDPEGFVQGIEARLAAREMVHNEVLYLADGQVWERDYIPIFLDGECHGHLWLYLDVTERMRAQEALQASLEKYQALVEAATVLSSSLDPDAVLDHLLEQVSRVIPNDAVNIMLIEDGQARIVRWRGYERMGLEAYVSNVVFDLQQTANLRQMIETGAPLVIPDTELYAGWVRLPEVSWLRSYVGAPIIVRGVVVGFLNLDKATPNFFTPAHAATLRAFAYHAAIALENARLYQKLQQELAMRAQIEAALRESEAYFHALFDQASDAIFIQDLDDHILDANRRACEMLGYTREALLNMTIPDLQAPECRGVRGHVIQNELSRYKGMPFEGIDVRSDGVRVPIEVTTSPLRVGERELAFSIVRDISERKEMEERLRRQERLAAVGQLAAGIAHDFRNLLTTIILYAQLGMRKPDVPAAVLSYLNTIVGEAHKATDLVQQILDFSSRSLIERQPLDLAALIGEVFAILRRTIPENIHIALEVGPGKFIVEADPGRIQQALTNLALNARDAMPGGGTLRIGLERLYLPAGALPPLPEMTRAIEGSRERSPNPAWICLTVADTGIGMTDSVRAHLFEPFFTTKEAGKGTGLGLAQVYGIIRQHDGYIGVETEVGKGTTFRIYLPASATEVEEPAPGATTVPLGHGELILLVEDNANLREAGKSMLAELGYRVLTATNGREALTLFRTSPDIALVITDLIMPEMGGEALLNELKRLPATRKVLAITGYTMQIGIRALKAAGFYDVVHKPFDADTLAHVIHRALSEP
ncbi:MAG TPA: PAS domain S-box protein [Anaerolineae bacterium]|nr:PAS domain S-box protein [Anaerolineae bacterium]HQK14857.1 PAS domain S-box protein [Anaerolineae bacterium]